MTELTGLTAPEVRARVEQGQVNALRVRSTKSVGRIVTDNVFSLFNLVIFALGALVLAVGRWEQTLFVFAALGNTAVGIVQELRTKFTIERLSLLTDKNAVVLRDGQEQTVPQHEIVRDDIVCLRTGAQIVVDGDIVEGGVLVSEALITGESDALAKNTGDEVLSGSFAVGGSARMRVRHIGGENYAVRLAAAVKKFHPAHSEIIHTLRLIIRAVAIALIPLGALLAWRQWSLTQSFADTVLGSAASLVSLIPEGLVLLTTTVFAVAVFRLARHKVLVQELYAVEALARVDVLCIDKTGTLTEGRMTVAQVHPLTGEDIHTPLSAFCRALDDTSPTFAALSAYFTQDPGWLASDTKAFSSACPYSAVTFDGKQYRLGAPECLIEPDETLRELIDRYAAEYRVLLFMRDAPPGDIQSDTQGGTQNDRQAAPHNPTPLALLCLSDVLRPDAADAIAYFQKQGVTVKVLSGDNPVTAGAVAHHVGLDGESVDARTLADNTLPAALDTYTVFGRVTPAQKKQMVEILQQKGRVVAMMGDGANDVLALRQADCGVAVAAGTSAARGVANIVLMDDRFSSLPAVVAEGRRAIGNLQRSASLFLAKTLYAALLLVLTLALSWEFPFVPLQVTAIGAFSIGIPSFFLGIELNRERSEGQFLWRILRQAMPAGLCVAVNIVLIMLLGPRWFSETAVSTLGVLSTYAVSMLLLFSVCRPFTLLRRVVLAGCLLLFILCVTLFGQLLSLAPFTWELLLAFAALALFAGALFMLLKRLFDRLFKERFIDNGKPV